MLRFAFFLAVACAVAGDVIRMHDGRIVGGKPTSIEKYPHQVSLQRLSNAHFCGGSIFSEKYIVTAAHCVAKKEASTFNVRVGTSRQGEGGQVYTLDWCKSHPDFTMQKLHGDVAVLKLKEAITFGIGARPVSLTRTEPRQGQMLTVTGWGTLNSGDVNLPKVLQVVRVPALDRTLCKFAYGEDRLTEAMICAGVTEKDSCQGDSGGPLINDKRELVGIVSFGKGCGSAGYPGIYANIASETIQGFILENTKE